jgi:hypothetical protein
LCDEECHLEKKNKIALHSILSKVKSVHAGVIAAIMRDSEAKAIPFRRFGSQWEEIVGQGTMGYMKTQPGSVG